VPEFIPGRELSRSFFTDVVKPILDDRFPSLRYAAALLGTGSEVLGYDTEMSADHEWGPRVDLFVREDEPPDVRVRVDAALRDSLPATFSGYSTHFGPPDPKNGGVRVRVHAAAGPISHKIRISAPREFFSSYLGVDVAQPLEPADWLTVPEQKLRTITSGPVFHDQNRIGGAATELRVLP
jgi:hypothetical protein